MVESFVEFAQGLPVWAILVSTFVIAYIEHVFPPSPSDLLIAFIGTLVGIEVVGLVPTLIVATAGSVTGFASAYGIGRRYGRSLLESRWVPFITPELIDRVNAWFDRYHGLIIVGNRFLAGTRAVIAFAAGMAHLPFPRTLVYSTVSAAVWNLLLLYAGILLGSQWQEIDRWLSIYGWVIVGLVALFVAVLLIRKWKRRSAGTAVHDIDHPDDVGDIE